MCGPIHGNAGAGPSADELVRQAQAHEAAREEDVAARRYTEALSIEATHAGAWIGLGDLRMRLGELAEAERVFTAARARVPSLSRALERRARIRWAMGRHVEAEADLEQFAEETGDSSGFRALAGWFGADGRTPRQLATWRRLLRWADEREDRSLYAEARLMVRALVALVGDADPASCPIEPDSTRSALANMARRGR